MSLSDFHSNLASQISSNIHSIPYFGGSLILGSPLQMTSHQASALAPSFPAQTTTTTASVRLFGDSNNNTLRGSAQNDILRGVDGNDRLIGFAGNDRLFGDRGHDTLLGGANNDILTGGSGNNRLQGDGGNDRLVGNTGRDRLIGGAGDDVLISGGGVDRITGSGGRDRFILSRQGSSTAAQAPIITDFTSGQDSLQVAGLTLAQLRFVQGTGSDALHTYVQERATGRTLAVLQNVQAATLELPTDNALIDRSRSIDETPGTGTTPDLGEGVLAFSTSNFRVNEAAGTAEVTVTRTGSTKGIVRVNYSTANNTATAGQDYSTVSGLLEFDAGETSQTITISIAQDNTFEMTEVIRLSLTNATNGGTLGNTRTALLKIINDDLPTESALAGRSNQKVTSGETTIYIGTHQVSTGNDIGNQDPWMASFTNGVLNWYRDDYEITNDDSKGSLLAWDGGDRLYATFTSTGTQGTADEDFRRFARNGWLRSYSDASPGGGGGGRVGILARLNPATGEVTAASFLTALNGNKTNSVFVDEIAIENDNLVVQARSAFAPRKPDKTAMTRNGVTAPTDAPNYTVTFAPDLSSVVSAIAIDYA